MSIDISITVGVGFVISDEVWTAMEAAGEAVGLWDEEIFEKMEAISGPNALLTYGNGGNYMGSDTPIRHFVEVKRLSVHIDGKNPSSDGVFPIMHTTTEEETAALLAVAAEIGEVAPIISSFYSILVH